MCLLTHEKIKFMKFPILISSLALLLLACSQPTEVAAPQLNYEPYLKQQQLLEDYDLFRSIYEAANAGLYNYHSKTEIDSVFAAQRLQIKDSMTYRTFFNILWEAIDYTGSCHNELKYPDSLDEELSKRAIFFSLPLKYVDGKLLVNSNDGQIPVGSEIRSVNGMNAAEFAKAVAAYVSTDGFNTTGKYANLASDWLPFHVYLALGAQQEFKLEYVEPNKNKVKQHTLQAVTYKEFYENYKQRHSAEFDDRFDQKYAFRLLDNIGVGLLEVHSFSIGGPESKGHKRYATFLDSVFRSLEANGIKKLIVDIRGNGGGNDPNDLLLYSYLTNRTFKENTRAVTRFQEIPYPQYYADDDIDELPDELKEEHKHFLNGYYHQDASFNQPWQPKAQAFRGKVVLLVDPFVASAGSLFASMMKSDDHVVVIGEETLGGYYGHTGHIPVTYRLPNSQFELTFSIVDLDQDVRRIPDEQLGDGVKPDIHVVQSVADFIENKDTQFRRALDEIRKE